MKNYSYYVYMLSSESGALYLGVTNDLARRLSEHKQDLVEGFTKKYKCHLLVYHEHFTDITQAIAREKYLKGKKREFKVNLIRSINPKWSDLSVEWAN